jgi:hypothetical protein
VPGVDVLIFLDKPPADLQGGNAQNKLQSEAPQHTTRKCKGFQWIGKRSLATGNVQLSQIRWFGT